MIYTSFPSFSLPDSLPISVFFVCDAPAFLNPSLGYAPAALGMVCLPLFIQWRFTMNPASSNTKSYFDLHTSGIGYLQRVRMVPVRGGRRAESFLACSVAALVGRSEARRVGQEGVSAC